MTLTRQQQIDRFMLGIYPPNRYRWCHPPGAEHGCACMGCADNSGGAREFMVYEEWQAWVARTPRPNQEKMAEQERTFSRAGGRAVSDPLLTLDEMHLCREGYKAAAIKRIRTRLGLNLPGARTAITEYVESLESGAWR